MQMGRMLFHDDRLLAEARADLEQMRDAVAIVQSREVHAARMTLEQLHAELGTAIANTKVQLLIAVGKLAKIAADTAEKKTGYDLRIKYFEDTFSACNNLQEFIKDNDIILVKGSRVARLEMATEKIKDLF